MSTLLRTRLASAAAIATLVVGSVPAYAGEASVQAAAPTLGPLPGVLSPSSTRSSFARLQRSLSGPAGVVVFPLGATSTTKSVLSVGTWHRGVAWSTSKVPLTIAALKRSSSATARRRAKLAITRSDNAAASALWRGLGKPKTAGKRVQAVIRQTGDSKTIVQYRRVRPGFTAFGQTQWALTDQARFAAGLPCLVDARATLTLMRHVTKRQRWGLGKIKGTAFKGGWGPVGRGYLVRQLGIVTLPDGRRWGVAIAVWSPAGFTRGTADLSKIARWLAPRLAVLATGLCRTR